MNRLARRGLVSAMVAGGVLASAGYAQADASAGGEAAGSPGVLSGNGLQVPVHVPVNVCGNTVSVAGLLNAVSGNACANGPAEGPAGATSPGAAGTSGASDTSGASAASGASRTGGGALALGGTRGSAGVLSGNGLQLPLDLPVNVTGNGVDVVGVGNPSTGNTSVNAENPAPPAHTPNPAPPAEAAPAGPTASAEPTLAHTGADGAGAAAAGSLVLLLGGTLLHRRARSARR